MAYRVEMCWCWGGRMRFVFKETGNAELEVPKTAALVQPPARVWQWIS